MLRFLSRLFCRKKKKSVPKRLLILDEIDGVRVRQAIAVSRKGHYLRVIRDGGKDILITRDHAVFPGEFDAILRSFPLFTEPMFDEDGNEVDTNDFY